MTSRDCDAMMLRHMTSWWAHVTLWCHVTAWRQSMTSHTHTLVGCAQPICLLEESKRYNNFWRYHSERSRRLDASAASEPSRQSSPVDALMDAKRRARALLLSWRHPSLMTFLPRRKSSIHGLRLFSLGPAHSQHVLCSPISISTIEVVLQIPEWL